MLELLHCRKVPLMILDQVANNVIYNSVRLIFKSGLKEAMNQLT